MRWMLAAGGLGAFAAALVALAPATLIDARLDEASGGRLRIAEAQGSVWSGRGWIEARDVHGTAGIARRIAWRVQPLSLLRARLVAQVEIDGAGKGFALTLSPWRFEIAGARVELPAAALGLGMPRLAPLGLAGEVRIDIPRFALEAGHPEGDATLEWRAAGSALTPLRPLGDYEVRFKAAGASVRMVLRTLAGPLELEGEGTLASDAAPRYLATARIAEPQREQLAPLLRMIAVERGAGSFELSSARPAFGG